MNIEFSLLQALTVAIETERKAKIAADDAFKAAYMASAKSMAVATSARVAADATASHARHELAAALAAARMYVTTHQ